MSASSHRCPVCGAVWSGPVRWCGACGAALPTDEPPASSRSEQSGPRSFPWGARGVAALGLVVLLVALGVWLAGSGGDPAPSADDEVALPDQDVLADVEGGNGPTDAPASATAGSRMACAPPGCQMWRVDEPSGQDVVASEGLVLQLRREQTTAYDSTTGRIRWERPTPAYASRSTRLTAVSPHGMAFVHGGAGGLRTSPTPEPSRSPVRVSIHDPVDGSHRVDVELQPGSVQRTFWVDDRLVLVVVGLERPVARTVVLTPWGEVVWRQADTGIVRPLRRTAGLLAAGEASVALLDPADGKVRWQVDGTLVTRSERADPMVVHDPADRVLRVVDPATGEVRRRLPVDDTQGVVAFGPWVLVRDEDTVRVVDPATGRALFTRPDPTPASAGEGEARQPPGLLRVSRAVRSGERVVVAWGDATTDDGIELAIHGLDGALQGTVTVPVDAVMGGAIGLHDVAGREGVVLVHLSTGAGPEGSIAVVDVQAQEVTGVTDGRLVATDGDLVAIQRDQGLTIIGPVGQLQVRHVRHVAALDPLVVHGVGGIMRLDRSLVTGEGDR